MAHACMGSLFMLAWACMQVLRQLEEYTRGHQALVAERVAYEEAERIKAGERREVGGGGGGAWMWWVLWLGAGGAGAGLHRLGVLTGCACR